MTIRPANLALMLFVAGCSDPLDFCQSCLKEDPALVVPKADITKIALVYSDRKLPPSAINVHYYEVGGPDH